MKTIVNILFYVTLFLLPLGIYLKYQDVAAGNLVFATGTLGILIYYSVSLVIDVTKKRGNKLLYALKLLLMLCVVVLFSKYLNYFFGDYVGLLIIPLFIVCSLFYFIKNNFHITKELVTTLLFYVLLIPLFFFSFHRAPRKFIPTDWYNRYGTDTPAIIEFPFDF